MPLKSAPHLREVLIAWYWLWFFREGKAAIGVPGVQVHMRMKDRLIYN